MFCLCYDAQPLIAHSLPHLRSGHERPRHVPTAYQERAVPRRRSREPQTAASVATLSLSHCHQSVTTHSALGRAVLLGVSLLASVR